MRDRGMEGWRGIGGGRFGRKRPEAITCPGSTCPLPAGPAHLDPAGLSGHLVHPPPALNANPFHRGAPHVGASSSHVSTPPAQVPGQPGPSRVRKQGGGAMQRGGGGAPAPSPDARSGERAREAGSRPGRLPGLLRRDRKQLG